MGVLWGLWKQRNEVIFRGKRMPLGILAGRIKEETTLWLSFCKGGNHSRVGVMNIIGAN